MLLMRSFEPRASQIKEKRRDEANKSTRLKPRPPYSLWSISLFKPKPHDKAASCVLSTIDPRDPDLLQRCMDLVFPWRVDLYVVSKTAFQLQFTEPCSWRDITWYTRRAFEELD